MLSAGGQIPQREAGKGLGCTLSQVHHLQTTPREDWDGEPRLPRADAPSLWKVHSSSKGAVSPLFYRCENWEVM